MSRSRTLASAPLAHQDALSSRSGSLEHHQREEAESRPPERPRPKLTPVKPGRARGLPGARSASAPEHSSQPSVGREHGCTPILMADGTVRPLSEVKVGDAIFGTVREDGQQRYVKTEVLAHWSVIKPAFRIVLEDGTELLAGGDQRFLTPRGWKYVSESPDGKARPHLSVGDRLLGTGAFAPRPAQDPDYKRGYICGLLRGYAASDPQPRPHPRSRRRRGPAPLIPCGGEAWDRAERWLREWRTEAQSTPVAVGGTPPARAPVPTPTEEMQEAIRWPITTSLSWAAGFLAGSFDTAGSHTDGSLRICHPDAAVISRIGEALRLLNIPRHLELVPREGRPPAVGVRILGGLAERLRFFHGCDPANNVQPDISDQPVTSDARLRIVAIEPLRAGRRLHDITTGTGDFIANGVISHNCHEPPKPRRPRASRKQAGLQDRC